MSNNQNKQAPGSQNKCPSNQIDPQNRKNQQDPENKKRTPSTDDKK